MEKQILTCTLKVSVREKRLAPGVSSYVESEDSLMGLAATAASLDFAEFQADREIARPWSSWQPALPRLLFLVHTVSKPIAVQTFTFLAGLQDRRYPPTTVRGALHKLALNVLLGVLPNVLWRLVSGVWWNKVMCARPRVELTASAIRTLTLGCYPHIHV